MKNENKDIIYDPDNLPEKREKIDFEGFDSRGGGGRNRNADRERKSLIIGLSAISFFILLFLTMIFALCMNGVKQDDDDIKTTDISAAVDENTVAVGKDEGDIGYRELSVSEIYKKCISSVVSISAKRGASSGVGSGFVYSSDGYIATANHVVDGMEEIYVIFSDGVRCPAALIMGDQFTDIALLRVERIGLKAVELGDSSALLVGERVVAIGTPASLDYAGSASSGEISYLDRTVKIYNENDASLEKKMILLQTNAPLNPGNSGCPLFDSLGRVVGMVTMKLGNNYSGMGFAIPSNGAADILEAMKNKEELTDKLLSSVCIKGAKLGVVGERSSENNVDGVRISGFTRDDCDAACKLKKGDLITFFRGEAVDSPLRLAKMTENLSAGDKVSVTVVRLGQELTFEVELTT